MRKNYALLDVIRLVMAVLVLYIHVPAFADSFEEVNYLLKYGIARLAVPFFFICNGYFSFSQNIANIKLQARKMLQLYCIWTLIYSPIILYNFVIDPRKSILMKTLLILRDFLLIGSYSQLWYLLAAALGFLLLYSMLQAHWTWKWILFVAALLYGIGVFYEGYREILELSIFKNMEFIEELVNGYNVFMGTARNGLFFGFPFIALGYWMKKKESFYNGKSVQVFLGGSIVLVIIEALGRYQAGGSEMLFSLFPASYFLFCALTQSKWGHDTHRIRKLSALLFFEHQWVNFIYSILKSMGIGFFCGGMTRRFMVVLCTSFLVGELVLLLSDKTGFRYLKKLY